MENAKNRWFILSILQTQIEIKDNHKHNVIKLSLIPYYYKNVKTYGSIKYQNL